MAPRLSGQTSMLFGVFFVSKSLLGFEKQRKKLKFWCRSALVKIKIHLNHLHFVKRHELLIKQFCIIWYKGFSICFSIPFHANFPCFKSELRIPFQFYACLNLSSDKQAKPQTRPEISNNIIVDLVSSFVVQHPKEHTPQIMRK